MDDYLSQYYNEHETSESVYDTTMEKSNQKNIISSNKNQTKNEIRKKAQPEATDMNIEEQPKKEAYTENTSNSDKNLKQNAGTKKIEMNEYSA